MSQKVHSIADERLEEGLVPGRRSCPRALDQESWGRATNNPRRAVRVKRRRRRDMSRLALLTRGVDRRRAGDDRFNGATDVKADDWARRSGRQTRARRRATVLSRSDSHDRVGGDDRVRFLDPIFERVVVFESVRRGLIHVDRLLRQGRQRMQDRRLRPDELFRKWSFDADGEGSGRLRARRSGERTQAIRACHVE